MTFRRLMAVCVLVASATLGTLINGSVGAAADLPDPDHPFSDPIWSPLRAPTKVSCAKTNCDGPYHGYDAIDFIGERGDPIYAAGAGILHVGGVAPGCSSGEPHSGTWVWIDHGPAGSSRYYHLDSITASDGQYVTPHTQIGTMGSSGDLAPCETNYLHFELRDSGTVGMRQPLSSSRACVDDIVVQLPQHMGFPTWDDVPPQRHFTPATDNGCLPTTWSDTPDRPPAVTIEPGVGSLTVRVPDRPAEVDDVRVRLQLFHPSLNAFGTIIERAVSPRSSIAVIDNLLPNRMYRSFVSFHNAAGWSAWSDPVAETTGFEPQPPEFRSIDSTYTTVGYRWYLGSNSGADHTVAIRQAMGSSWGPWTYAEVAKGDLHHRYQDLQPGTRYQVTVRAHNAFGTSGWAPYRTISTLCASACLGATDVFTPLQPARLADSRDALTIDGRFRDTGRRAGGTTWEIAVAGRAGVPSDATAAVLNLTVLNGASPGHATVYPCGDRPNASSVNYSSGTVVPNEVIARLSASGTVCVYTLTTVDVVLDVVGFVGNSPYHSLAPARFADSRDQPTTDGRSRNTGPRRAGTVWEIPIAGRGSISSSAASAVLNLTVAGAAGPGFATVYPCGERPLASSLNFDSGAARANELVTKLSSSGTICVYTMTSTDIIVDVVGFLDPVDGYTPMSPARVADSRNQDTVDGKSRNTGIRPAGTWEIPIVGRAGVDRADAVMANVTVAGATRPGFLSVFDCGSLPNASTVNYVPGAPRANETFAKLSERGSICVYSSAPVHIIVDVVGYTDT